MYPSLAPFPMWLWPALNSRCSCFQLPSAGITGVGHHVCLTASMHLDAQCNCFSHRKRQPGLFWQAVFITLHTACTIRVPQSGDQRYLESCKNTELVSACVLCLLISLLRESKHRVIGRAWDPGSLCVPRLDFQSDLSLRLLLSVCSSQPS